MSSADQVTMDWVQYHKIKERGWPEKPLACFGIFSHKNLRLPNRARVWLIAGEKAKPTYHYYLIEWFMVDNVEMNNENGENRASGRQGAYLGERTRIDGEPWFAEFKQNMQNFHFGLSPITNEAVIKGLEKVAGISSVPIDREKPRT
jgi:hypothetical protein